MEEIKTCCEDYDYCRKCHPDAWAILHDHKFLCHICQADKIKELYEGDGEYNEYLFGGGYSNYKQCRFCGKHYCLNCTAITGCQTTEGICKNCFDYKCEICKERTLSKEKNYLWDETPHAYCANCCSPE